MLLIADQDVPNVFSDDGVADKSGQVPAGGLVQPNRETIDGGDAAPPADLPHNVAVLLARLDEILGPFC